MLTEALREPPTRGSRGDHFNMHKSVRGNFNVTNGRAEMLPRDITPFARWTMVFRHIEIPERSFDQSLDFLESSATIKLGHINRGIVGQWLVIKLNGPVNFFNGPVDMLSRFFQSPRDFHLFAVSRSKASAMRRSLRECRYSRMRAWAIRRITRFAVANVARITADKPTARSFPQPYFDPKFFITNKTPDVYFCSIPERRT